MWSVGIAGYIVGAGRWERNGMNCGLLLSFRFGGDRTVGCW